MYYLIDYLDETSKKKSEFNKEEIQLTNNVLRILTRIIPILHEADR